MGLYLKPIQGNLRLCVLGSCLSEQCQREGAQGMNKPKKRHVNLTTFFSYYWLVLLYLTLPVFSSPQGTAVGEW
jgi:hypothetical protein